MAFVSKVGGLLKQSGSNHVSRGLSSSVSPFFKSITSMSSAKLFVGGLSDGTDEMGLREAFQEYGEVIEAKVITDQDSGRSRGFGYVSYTSADAANSALQDMDGKELHGQRIIVSFAQERPRPPFVGGGGYGGAGSYSGGGGFGGGGGGGFGGGGGYGDRNQNADDGDNLFGGGVGAASGISPGGGNEDDVGTWNHDSARSDGKDDYEDDDYGNTSKKCEWM